MARSDSVGRLHIGDFEAYAELLENMIDTGVPAGQ